MNELKKSNDQKSETISHDSDTVEIMMNESRTSNNQKSESISYESDSDNSVVYKFVENILLSRAKERTNLNRLERKDESPVELSKVNTEKIMPPKTNKRKVSNLK